MSETILEYKFHKPKILAVDDKPENLFVLEKLLSPLDVEIHKALSGNEALSKTLENDYMLVLLDVQMPEMDGYEVAEILSWNEKTKYIPIIFITANYADEKHEIRGYQLGAVDYLFKPINKEILIGKVKVFIELFQQRTELQNLHQAYQSILDSAADGIIGVDPEGKIVFANPAASKILNISISKLHEIYFLDLVYNEEPTETLQQWKETLIYKECIINKTHTETDAILMKSDKSLIPVHFTATPLKDQDDDFAGIVIVFSDITLQKTVEAQLKRLALYDHLTQLPNRVFFEKTFAQTLARAERHSGLFAIMMLDLDHFKNVNDTLGHDAGDALLKEVGKRLKSCLRKSDTLARLGGDEFAIILDEILKPDDAKTVAQKIIDSLNRVIYLDNAEVYTGASIGIAIYPFSGDSQTQLLKNADTAMYRSKEQGRGQYSLFALDMNKEHLYKKTLANDLRQALHKNEMMVYYQPILNLHTNKVTRIEALLRWNHSTLRTLNPSEFLPIVNEIGLTNEIHEWLLQEASSTFLNWQNYLGSDCQLSINISENLLSNTDLLDSLLKHFKNSSLKPENLEVELTESVIMNSSQDFYYNLQAVSKLGVSICIDDFGTGFSSLKRLNDLPVHTIKIHNSLIHEVESDDIIIKAGIALAHTLNLKVIAEGVETESQFNLLKSMDCDEAQGFYFCRPLPANELDEFIKNRS